MIKSQVEAATKEGVARKAEGWGELSLLPIEVAEPKATESYPYGKQAVQGKGFQWEGSQYKD